MIREYVGGYCGLGSQKTKKKGLGSAISITDCPEASMCIWLLSFLEMYIQKSQLPKLVPSHIAKAAASRVGYLAF